MPHYLLLFFVKKQRTIKRKKRSHKGRGLATCRRIKIDPMSLSNCERAARNSSSFEDSSPIISIDVMKCPCAGRPWTMSVNDPTDSTHLAMKSDM